MSAGYGLVLRGREQRVATSERPLKALNDLTDAPPPVRRAGTLVSVEPLSPGLTEVVVALSRRLEHKPGQHVRVAFGALPPRDYVPTLRMDGMGDLNELVFLLRSGPGRVVSEIGSETLAPGNLVRVEGPFGDAYHRPGPGRLVLVSTGAGFAASWAIARAARCLEPERPLVLVAGAREAVDLPFREAFDWLQGTGVDTLTRCASGRGAGGIVRRGRVTEYLDLRAGDVVHAAGAPAMVRAVAAAAHRAGAFLNPIPFTPAGAAAIDLRPALAF